MSVELALKDLESLFEVHPNIKEYVIEQIKSAKGIFALDMVTYKGASFEVKKLLGLLLLEHGELFMERAMKLWVKNHAEIKLK